MALNNVRGLGWVAWSLLLRRRGRFSEERLLRSYGLDNGQSLFCGAAGPVPQPSQEEQLELPHPAQTSE